MCLSPLYNVLGTVPEIFPLFVQALICVALHLVSLAVSALLGHVAYFFALLPGDDPTRISFWEYMADIPQS